MVPFVILVPDVIRLFVVALLRRGLHNVAFSSTNNGKRRKVIVARGHFKVYCVLILSFSGNNSQVSLIFTPPRADQSQYKVAVFLLVGCLGYSNSAINPILYAFLSDNFKKSFMKVL